ncbi:MAG: hypothetical protein V7647_2186 [Acidobacteriota bacterium]|jgi:ABC-type uncharacterized transport system auxiliary subunit
MYRHPGKFTAFLSSAVLVAASLAGCSRSDNKNVPTAEVQTQQPAQAVNKPITLTGCMRAGESSDTFVLTTSATADGEAPATYQLAGASGVNLREQIGNRVEVSGVVRSQQQTESHTSGPAANAPTGTSGAPRVETTTELDIKHLDVSSVKSTGQKCDK